MSEKEKVKKVRKHPFFDKHFVLGLIVLVVWNFFFPQICTLFVKSETLQYYVSVIAGIVAALIYAWWFKAEYVGNIKGRTKEGIKLALFALIYYVFLILQTLITGKFAMTTVTFLGIALSAGVCEEVVFRGIIVSYCFRKWREEKFVPAILLISSIIFGLVHMINVKMGASFSITVIQVIGAMGTGALLAAIFIRSGNLIIVMVVHTITDLLAFMDSTQTSTNGMIVENIGINNILDVVVCAVLFVIALYLIRPAKRKEITELWNMKWRRE